MIATLRFNIPEEEWDFQCAVDGHKWRRVVSELDQAARNALKYGVEGAEIQTLDDVRPFIYRLLEEEGLSLDD